MKSDAVQLVVAAFLAITFGTGFGIAWAVLSVLALFVFAGITIYAQSRSRGKARAGDAAFGRRLPRRMNVVTNSPRK